MPSQSIQQSPSASPLSSISSPDLFRSCVAGASERAWTEFVARFHGRIIVAVRRALVRFGNPGEDGPAAEDLVQEVYCRLLGDGSGRLRFHGQSEAQLMTYLQRVARSVVVDAFREALADKRRGGQRVAWLDSKLAPAAGVAPARGPDERLQDGERRRAFLSACRQALGRRATPAAVRIARLALLEGWTSREIAARPGARMGRGAVDSFISRLRHDLAASGIALPRRDRAAR
jgi:DNA-directed RNA polymerase specialized sigma24 family protein